MPLYLYRSPHWRSMFLTSRSCWGRKLMGPHSSGPQVSGYVSSSFRRCALTSAAAARAPKDSASAAPLQLHQHAKLLHRSSWHTRQSRVRLCRTSVQCFPLLFLGVSAELEGVCEKMMLEVNSQA
jgi:hypothetical protein